MGHSIRWRGFGFSLSFLKINITENHIIQVHRFKYVNRFRFDTNELDYNELQMMIYSRNKLLICYILHKMHSGDFWHCIKFDERYIYLLWLNRLSWNLNKKRTSLSDVIVSFFLGIHFYSNKIPWYRHDHLVTFVLIDIDNR
jgi:hypothetical protein